MKFIYLLLSIMILMSSNINAQIVLTLKNIKVAKINVPISENFIREGDDEGPYVNMFFVFNNNTDSVLKLHPSNSKMILQFRYENKYFNQNIFAIPFMDSDTLIIMPHQQYESFVGESLLLGTSILKHNNNDYRIELIEILPTIKLVYMETKINIKSSEILNVEIIDKKIDNLKHKK